ncbi:unnamed protein product [Staurois parvus]|uniref:Uncharacterized protein n=1 Tax=Staurois parvus TaxID=386267 RepID=A0ABN9GX17_9NEOB|nr:unnamed protein product [Staurois parvus]
MPPVSVHQCHLSVFINATCQCSSMPPASATSMPHISAYQCTSMPHIIAHLSYLSVSPISASQCHLSMPVSATNQYCQSVPTISASQCHLSVPPNSALTVPVSAA